MKRILITGKGSYIGTNFKKYLEEYPEKYYVEELDVRDEGWKEFDFTRFDVVFHVAGIAHIKEIKENESLYYKINRDLALDVAKKAKESGVHQFIFMSSMSVYGLTHSQNLINKQTKCIPNTYYGKSKYEAEKHLEVLKDDIFNVVLVRPPMVYGKDSPGNLTKLFKAVRKFHVFPTVKNKRSSVSVNQLIILLEEYIDTEATGIQLPQNNEYMCTYEILKKEMKEANIKVLYIPFFNPIIRLLIGRVSLITKCFGDLIYEK